MNTPGQTLHSRCQPNRRPLTGQQREFVRLRSRRPGPTTRTDRSGGARRDRTDDLMLAKHALYQLSYGPKECVFWALSVVSCHRSAALHRRSGGPKVYTPKTVGSVVGPGRLELPTSRLSGVCSNQLSYRPLKRFALSQRSRRRNVLGIEPGGLAIAPHDLDGRRFAERETKTADIPHLILSLDDRIDREDLDSHP
jgi:hypothetical protein